MRGNKHHPTTVFLINGTRKLTNPLAKVPPVLLAVGTGGRYSSGETYRISALFDRCGKHDVLVENASLFCLRQ